MASNHGVLLSTAALWSPVWVAVLDVSILATGFCGLILAVVDGGVIDPGCGASAIVADDLDRGVAAEPPVKVVLYSLLEVQCDNSILANVQTAR